MPLIVYLVIAYVVGLYAGFATSWLVRITLAGVVVFLGAPRGRPALAAMLVVALAGAIIAWSSERDDIHCARNALAQQPVRLVLVDSVSPGSYSQASLADCEGASAAVSVDHGSAPAGSTVDARGVVTAAQHGVVVQHASVTVVRSPPLLDRLHRAAGVRVDSTFRGDAPFVRALILADRRELSPELRDRFAAAGLAHVLAIAGLHIGIIAIALELVLRVAGVARPVATLWATAAVVAYVFVIGAPVPALRSATMLVAFRAARITQRPIARWAVVALGAAQPIIAPRIALQIGYQLSVVGVTSMIAAAALARRVGVDRLSWLARHAAGIVLGTTVVTVASAPLVAWTFGRVSLIAPLSNVAATPLILLAQPMILLGLALSSIHPLGSFVADAVHPLLVGLDRVALYAASLRYASVAVAPSMTAVTIGAIVSVAVIIACASREWHRPAIVAAAAATLMIWLPLRPTLAGLVELHMIDVGQGDAIALRTPHGHWVLVDAGRAWRGGDAGRSTVLPYLGRRGGPLDLFVLSHPHTDHVGGAATVLHALHPKEYIDAGFPGGAEAYRASLDAARVEHVRWMRVHPGDSTAIDGVSLRFLAPDSAWTAQLIDPNLASVVVLVQFGVVRMLLVGDAERPEEDWLLEHAGNELHADILKVGHHGSITSSSDAFLNAVRPRLALVSVGAGNSYHLPTPAIMRRLAAHGAQVLRTDQLGTIVARTDGTRILIDAAGDEWELSPHSPPLGAR